MEKKSLQHLQSTMCQGNGAEGCKGFAGVNFSVPSSSSSLSPCFGFSGSPVGIECGNAELAFQVLGPALEQQKKAWSLQSMEGKCMKLSDDGREGYFGKEMYGVDLNKSVEEEDDGSFDAGKENENRQSKF
ncbi:hypothetical protein NE237_021945 [Protea cynaroides]|uniref:Uncharacterized protein n=1 Tax=Protea cynaroides TaxID=273540 RepID=A0A9Q0HCA6_9MAGN|nr:hypothetical protein NE237_021945 [Protea cynaroides]